MRGIRVLLGVTAVVLLAGCGGGKSASPSGPVGAGPSNVFHPVAGSFKADDTKLSDCKDDTKCFEQAFGNLSYEEGPKSAMALFAKDMATIKPVETDCHRIAHTIGSAALARYDGNVARAFSEGAATCWSGYYHGILERAFAPAKSRSDLKRIARGVCEDRSVRADTFLAYQCVHGLGHGLMIQSGYDLPLALSVCDGLATSWDQTSCTGGVFMENLSSSYGFTSRWLKKDDPVYPCNVVKPRHKTYCYLMVTSRILQVNGYDFAGAARTCAKVEKGWGGLCYQSLGRDASGHTRQDVPRILEYCALGGKLGRGDCVYGAARDMVSNDAGPQRAVGLCRAAGAADRARCFEGIGTILGTLHGPAAERRSACTDAAKADGFLAACLRGAGVAA